MRRVKVGLVGCGRNSHSHFKAFGRLKNVDVTGVYDVDMGRAQEVGRKFGVGNVFPRYENLLRSDVDLVDIVTPTPTHAKLATLALEAGHDVLVEKPMALTSREGRAMARAERKNGRTLCVVHNQLFYNSVIQIKQLLESENLEPSQLQMTKFAAARHEPPWVLQESNGGLLWEWIVHRIYMITYLLSDEIVTVFAVAKRVSLPVADSFALTLVGRSGAAATVQSENATRHPQLSLHLITKDGQRFYSDLIHDKLFRRSRVPASKTARLLLQFYQDLSEPVLNWTEYVGASLRYGAPDGPYGRTFARMISKEVDHIIGLAKRPPVTAEEGIQSLRLLEAAKQSIKTGQPQRVTKISQ